MNKLNNRVYLNVLLYLKDPYKNLIDGIYLYCYESE